MRVKHKPIRAYIYNGYAVLQGAPNRKWAMFTTLEEGLAMYASLRPRFATKQVVFIDFSKQFSKIVHILEPDVVEP